jgi:hypothetical protein
LLVLTLGLGAAGALACNKSKSGGGGGSVSLTLTEFGLKAQAPEGSTVEKGTFGTGLNVQGPDQVPMAGIEAATNDGPKTLAAAKDKASMYSPTGMKEVVLPDGWLISFESHGSMGTVYWVQSRREIGGRAISCGNTCSTPEQQANAIAVCKSLSK